MGTEGCNRQAAVAKGFLADARKNPGRKLGDGRWREPGLCFREDHCSTWMPISSGRFLAKSQAGCGRLQSHLEYHFQQSQAGAEA